MVNLCKFEKRSQKTEWVACSGTRFERSSGWELSKEGLSEVIDKQRKAGVSGMVTEYEWAS